MPDDPFRPDHGTSGYKTSNFYTSHGDKKKDAKEVVVKFDPDIWSMIMKLYVLPTHRFGKYTAISSFVADAMWHRHMQLKDEYPAWVEDDPEFQRQEAHWFTKASLESEAEDQALMQSNAETARRYMDQAADPKGWASPDGLAKLIEQTEELLPHLEDIAATKIRQALRRAKQNLAALRTDGQLMFRHESIRQIMEGDEFGDGIDPFRVTFD